jgi:hypothetical protein
MLRAGLVCVRVWGGGGRGACLVRARAITGTRAAGRGVKGEGRRLMEGQGNTGERGGRTRPGMLGIPVFRLQRGKPSVSRHLIIL